MGLEKKILGAVAKTLIAPLAAVPFMPRDKPIKIPFTKLGVTFNMRENSFARKHPMAINFALLGAYMFAATATVGIGDTALNSYVLYKSGWHRLQQKVYAPERLQLDRRAAESGKVDIAIYNVNFGDEGNSQYSRENLEDYLGTAFNRLGLQANITYQDVNVSEEWEARMREVFTEEEMQTPKRQALLERLPVEFREFVRGTKIEEPLAKRNPMYSIAGRGGTLEPQLITHVYMAEIVGRENYFELPLNIVSNSKLGPRADIGIVIADFKDSRAGGVAHNYSETSQGEAYVLIDKKRNGGKPRDQKSLNRTILHEALHKLGIGHSSFWSFDVMSYSPGGRLVSRHLPWLAIGPETWLDWRNIKGDLEKEKKEKDLPPLSQFNARSLQYKGKDRESFNRNGYASAPHVLGLKR